MTTVLIGGIIIRNIPVGNYSDTAKLGNGVQTISSRLESGKYPEITVQSGVPVKWTIKAEKGSINGCNKSIVSSDLRLEYTFAEGENLIEFTVDSPGDYSYTCWMGMIKGTVHAVDKL